MSLVAGLLALSALGGATPSQPAADLVATRVQGPARAFRGQPLTLDIELGNTGTGRAEGFVATVHLSTNVLISFASDPRVGTFGPFRVEAGAALALTVTATVPADLELGRYFVGVIVNPNGAAPELTLANNIARTATTVDVRDPAPDFVAHSVTVVSEAGIGEPLVVQRTLSNRGNAAGRVDYTVLLSTDATVDASDTALAEGRATLSAGAQTMGTDRPAIPVSVAPGVYRVLYHLDPRGDVDELDEDNNRAASETAVTVLGAGVPRILTTQLPIAVLDQPYAASLTAIGRGPEQPWVVAQGSLPPGITFDAFEGRISGSPLTLGSWPFTVALGRARQPLTFVVVEADAPLRILTRSVPPARVGQSFDYPLTAAGGVPPWIWSATGLPDGWAVTADGRLQGRSPAPIVETVAIEVADSVGGIDERLVVLRALGEGEGLRFASVPPDGHLGASYAHSFVFVPPTAQVALELTDGALPDGLAIDGARLAGTPTRVGQYVFGLRVTDANDDFDLQRFVVDITEADGVRFVSAGLPDGVVGRAYRDGAGAPVRLRAVGGDGARLSAADGLPPGLALRSNGTITGTPAVSGLFAFIARAQDASGQSDRRAFGIVIEDAPPAASPAGGCRCAARGPTTGWVWLMVGVVWAMGARRRGRSAGCRRRGLLALAVFAVPSPAAAQAYFTETLRAPYVSRTAGQLVRLSEPDDGTATVDLPFRFSFFGRAHRQLIVGANGYVTFGSSGGSPTNQALPDLAAPNDLIALAWDDLVGDLISWHVEGRAPTRVAILQIEDSIRRGRPAGGRPRVQLWLYEAGAGRFELRYGGVAAMTDPGAWSASVGFEGPDGRAGQALLSCGASCGGNELAALDGRILAAEQDLGPQLVAVALDAPTRLDPGLARPVTLALRSGHGRPLGPFTVALDLLDESGAVQVPEVRVIRSVTLAPYARRTLSATVAVPLGTAVGRYRLAARIDARAEIAEVDEADNRVVASEVTEVFAPAPDFVVDAVERPPPAVGGGREWSATAMIRNRGNAAAVATVQVVLSDNRAVTSADRELRRLEISLPAFSQRAIDEVVQVPADVPPGPYFLGVLVDPFDALAELDETNNAAASVQTVRVTSGPAAILTTMLGAATVDRFYQAFLAVDGGDGRYDWRLVDGALPEGLALDVSTGRIAGRPGRIGESRFTVAVNSDGTSARADLTLRVLDTDQPPVIVHQQLLPGIVGAGYPPTGEGPMGLVAAGGRAPVRFRMAGAPPASLALRPDGQLVGTPQMAGVFDLLFIVEDADGRQASRLLPLTIAEPGRLTLLAEALPPARRGQTFSFRLRSVGGRAPFAYAATALPRGLVLAMDGRISGRPQDVGQTVSTVTVTDDHGGRDEARFVFVVTDSGDLEIQPRALAAAIVGETYRATLSAPDGQPPLTWTVQGEPLPSGLTYRVATGSGASEVRIEGTAKALGSAALLVHVVDGEGRRAEQPFLLAARGASAITADGTGCQCAARGPRGAVWTAFWMLAGLLGLAVRRTLTATESPPNHVSFEVCSSSCE